MRNVILDLLNLHKGEESKHKTLENVKSNISFTGSNLWILACAIIIASIGLNVNSTAVIIGAMLISPLMGPIVGSGFALGMYDFDLLKRSLKNLLIATMVSLLVSTFYFLLSPFKEVQSELLARTSPNIYDVLIAFFGGLVGVIAITRVEKGNPIPGVAIATALMPPLCTAGFGLATGHFRYFFGALFLYSINCVFICIATIAIVKALKYPAVEQIDVKRQKQVHHVISAIILIMLLPSGYFAFSLYNQQQFKQRAEKFITQQFLDKGNILVYQKINYSNNRKNIALAFLKKNYSENEIQALNQQLPQYGLKNTTLEIKQNSSDGLQSLKTDILNEVNKKELVFNEKDKQIALLQQKLVENLIDNKQLFLEANSLFPNITALSASKQSIASVTGTTNAIIVVYKTKISLTADESKKLKDWLLKKFKVDNIDIFSKGDLKADL